MQNSKLPLRPSETSLILQGKIEDLTPQQLLIRDELVAGGRPLAEADSQVRSQSSLDIQLP